MDFAQWLSNLLAVFVTLGGVAALVAAVINVLKRFGVVTDGTAGNWSLVLNGVAFVLMVALGIFAKVTPVQFDAVAQQIATILIAILGLMAQFGFTLGIHRAVSAAGVPLFGYSHSRQK